MPAQFDIEFKEPVEIRSIYIRAALAEYTKPAKKICVILRNFILRSSVATKNGQRLKNLVNPVNPV
jgi:hypothetical protein